LISDFLSVQETGGRDLIHIQKSEFRNNENNAEFWAVLDQNWEVSILLHLDISRFLEFLLVGCWSTNLHNVKLLGVLIGLFLTEAEQGVLVVIGVSDWHISEGSCKPFKYLLLSLLDQEQLHMAADSMVRSLVDTNQIAPFSG
jgi:hypothetical protein